MDFVWTVMRMKKLMKFEFMENSLDWIRLFAALQVALSHYLNLIFFTYEKKGFADEILLAFKRCITLFPGVVILFAVSGFLMAASLDRRGNRLDFARKRFRRIYPGLWINIIFTLFLVIGLCRPAGGEKKELFLWMVVQGVGISYTPGFLKNFATGSINGALWTIMVEIQFYILLFLLWEYLRRKSDLWWKVTLVITFGINIVCYFAAADSLVSESAAALLGRTVLPYLFWFVYGMCLYRFGGQWIPKIGSKLPVLLVCYVAYKGCWQYFGWKVPGYYADFVTSLLLPCLVIGAAYVMGKHRLKTDFSYGIFLYHWLIINVIFYFDLPDRMNHVLLLAIYIAIFLSLALSSWVLVERRAIKNH